MSTYAIADAIEKLADNCKYAVHAINDRNKIEREKLEFEREKFENHKQKQEEICDHKWIGHGAAVITVKSPTTPIGCYEYLICEKCGTHILQPYAPHTFKT